MTIDIDRLTKAKLIGLTSTAVSPLPLLHGSKRRHSAIPTSPVRRQRLKRRREVQDYLFATRAKRGRHARQVHLCMEP